MTSPSSVTDFGLALEALPRPKRGITFVPADPTSDKEERLRASYAKLDTSGKTFDTQLATLYDPTFKAPGSYSFVGKIKDHGRYRVQSLIKIIGDRLVKVSVYTCKDERTRVFEIAKQDVQNEVIYQELARHLHAPFSVPEIFRFNYYEEDNPITLIEMQYIAASRAPNPREIDTVNDFLTSHGIHHNDLIVDGKYLDISTFDKQIYNTGNLIVDADGKIWVIDFGSASDVKDKPRGGTRRRKRTRNVN